MAKTYQIEWSEYSKERGLDSFGNTIEQDSILRASEDMLPYIREKLPDRILSRYNIKLSDSTIEPIATIVVSISKEDEPEMNVVYTLSAFES